MMSKNGLGEHGSSAFIFVSSGSVIKFVLRAASTLENKDSEQLALREFSATRNLSTDPNCLQPLRQVDGVRLVH